MTTAIDSSGGFVPEGDSLDLGVQIEGGSWSSPLFMEAVGAQLKARIRGNTRCFTRINVFPIYQKGEYAYYRVLIYMRDYLHESYISKEMIWRDYSVEVGLRDGRIFSTDPPLAGEG